MDKKTLILAAILIILLFVIGVGAIFYGLWLISVPIAFIVLGIVLITVSVFINLMIPSRRGGD